MLDIPGKRPLEAKDYSASDDFGGCQQFARSL
jgi:hypothetical protein